MVLMSAKIIKIKITNIQTSLDWPDNRRPNLGSSVGLMLILRSAGSSFGCNVDTACQCKLGEQLSVPDKFI